VAILLPYFPNGFGQNSCYRFMLDQWLEKKIDTWNYDELLENHHQVDVDNVINEGFLVKKRDLKNIDGWLLKLAFRELGTTAHYILGNVQTQIEGYQEFRSATRYPQTARCSPGRMRNLLVFLVNFNLIQVITEPNSGGTYITAEGRAEIDDELNRVYMMSDDLDTRLSYSFDLDEHLAELARYR